MYFLFVVLYHHHIFIYQLFQRDFSRLPTSHTIRSEYRVGLLVARDGNHSLCLLLIRLVRLVYRMKFYLLLRFLRTLNGSPLSEKRLRIL